MAKFVQIQFLAEQSSLNPFNSDMIRCPLLDDPTVEIKSQFSTMGELVPKLEGFVNLISTFQTVTSGTTSEGMMNLKNIFDIPRFQKADPVRMSLKLAFYTKESPKKDVWDPVRKLISYSIISQDPDNPNSYIVPGISLATMLEFSQGTTYSKKSKLISLEIPGVVYLDAALIESAIPTYSKQGTESGYPLWANVDLSILSVKPGNTSMFDDVENSWAMMGVF